jgi:regulator of RNase E activity RraA
MPVIIDVHPPETSSAAAIERWRQVPVAVAVDVSHAECQIDRSLRPLCAPGQQPRLFGRAVTALCEPPDFGAVLYALDKIKPGDVLVIAAGGHTDTAMIGNSGQAPGRLGLAGWSVMARSVMWRSLPSGMIFG